MIQFVNEIAGMNVLLLYCDLVMDDKHLFDDGIVKKTMILVCAQRERGLGKLGSLGNWVDERCSEYELNGQAQVRYRNQVHEMSDETPF